VRLATAEDPLALGHASQRWRQDEALVLSLVERNHRAYSCADPLLTGSRPFALAAAQRNGLCLSQMGAFVCDREIVSAAVCNNENALEYACWSLCNDPELLLVSNILGREKPADESRDLWHWHEITPAEFPFNRAHL